MKTLSKLICDFAYHNGKDNKQVLDDLLTYIIGSFSPEPQIIPSWEYSGEQNLSFFAMMQEYFRIMDEKLRSLRWFDVWGDLFMELTPKGGAKGQFFTPSPLCDMIAQATIDKGVVPSRPCGAFGNRVVISDPAAGSSRCLLAAHALFIEKGERKPYLIAEDVDAMCCKMSAINLMSHGCFGEVVCHDTLANPKEVKTGYIINEGLYPIPNGFPTIRAKHKPKSFVLLRQ